MEKESDSVYHIPAIRQFNDTGSVTHIFANKSSISAWVVKSDDVCAGADIELEIKDADGNVCCDIVLDKFSALCLSDTLIRNLLKQEEVLYGSTGRSS